jgi:ferritin-like metal-binding protein YciE
MSRIENLSDLLKENLKALYGSEKLQLDALPELVSKANDQQLKSALENHANFKKENIERIRLSFSILNELPTVEKNEVVESIIRQTSKTIKDTVKETITHNGIIDGVQQLNHYGIANYGTIAAQAKAIGLDNISQLLHRNLEQEKHTDSRLSGIAQERLYRNILV